MRIKTLAVAALLAAVTTTASAQSATQTVNYAVNAINELSISGGAVTLTVNAATAGSQPNSVSSTGITYAITTNGTAKKITGAINTAMPTGTTLTISLAAPTDASAAGAVTLGTAAGDLVTGITQKAASSLGITYTLSATVDAGIVSSAAKTVTLTIM